MPVWSADGSELFYRSKTDVMAVDVSAGDEFVPGKPGTLFADVLDRSGGISHTTYDVAPDGRFIFVARPRGTEDAPYGGRYRFQVVVNWIAEVEERVPAP